MSRLEDAVARFSAVPHARVLSASSDEGPEPWQPEADRYADRYPGLRRYPDYLEFLARFGGGAVYRPDGVETLEFLQMTIYGFGEFFEPSEEVDADGFFAFACLEARYALPRAEHSDDDGIFFRYFALDVSGSRPAMVYTPVPPLKPTQYVPRWPTFTDWLEDVADHLGRLPL
jgi:hypothetical protein